MDEEERHNNYKQKFDDVIKEEFGDITRTSEDILKEINDLTKEKYSLQREFELERKKIEFYKAEEKELKDKLNKIAAMRYEVEQTVKQANYREQEIKEKVTRLQRELKRQQLLEAENAEFRDAAKRFLDECISRPWFSIALEHQVIGAQSLAYVGRGFLGDYMGLGKTLTSIMWADMVKAHKVLVLAPKETCTGFIKEIQKWAPDRMIMDLVSKNKSYRDFQFMAMDLAKPDQFIIVANIETWRKDPDFIQDIIKQKVDCVIVDESHVIKNKGGNAFKGIKEIVYAQNSCYNCGGQDFRVRNIIREDINTWQTFPCWTCKSCDSDSFVYTDTCSVKNVLCMTGTPILNRPQELWPILHLINKELFPDEKSFLRDYCIRDDYTLRWRFRYGGIERLAKSIGKMFVMRDYDSAGIKIPEQQVHVYELDFGPHVAPEQWKAYRMLAEHELIMLGDKEVIPVNYKIVLLTRFRQMATWPEGIEFKNEHKIVVYRCPVRQSVKLDRAERLAKELIADGERVILFSKFKKPLQELHRRLNGFILEDALEDDKCISSVIYDGDTPPAIKDQIKEDFDKKYRDKRNGKFQWDIVLANYAVGGQSVTFTEAVHTIILDEEWNPGKRDQAYGRNHRIGQDRQTIVHLLRLKTSTGIPMIDDFMASLINEKEAITGEFESSTKATTEELVKLLRETKEIE